jgi:hypothetical protein
MNNGAKKVEDAAKKAADAGAKAVAGVADAGKEVVKAGEKVAAGAADAVKDAAKSTVEAAKDMIGDVAVPGFSDLQKNFSGMFDTVGPLLGGIKDAAGADAALPDLEKAVTGLDGMMGTLGGMPDIAKSAVSSMVQSQLDKIGPVIDNILGMQGVGEKVVTVLKSLKDKLGGLVIKK